MKPRSMSALAREAQMSPQHLCCCLHGRRNAAGLNAVNLAELTGTGPRLWLKGGDLSKRREAFEAWSHRGAAAASE